MGQQPDLGKLLRSCLAPRLPRTDCLQAPGTYTQYGTGPMRRNKVFSLVHSSTKQQGILRNFPNPLERSWRVDVVSEYITNFGQECFRKPVRLEHRATLVVRTILGRPVPVKVDSFHLESRSVTSL